VKRFAILDESTSEGFQGLETMILVKGAEDYAAILKRAFPDWLSMDRTRTIQRTLTGL
jgi:hypothetical protein